MERTMEQERASRFRHAVKRLALAVCVLAEERHVQQGHQRPFIDCGNETCRYAVLTAEEIDA